MPSACPCDWGEDCAKLAQILASGSDSTYNGTDGHEPRIFIQYQPTSWRNAVIRAFVEKYFNIPENEVERHSRYRIYRHHFHPNLLKHLLGDPSDEKPKHQISMPLPTSTAEACGISGIVNQYRLEPDGEIREYSSSMVWDSKRDSTQYVAIPNYGKENYRHLLDGQSPRRTLVREVWSAVDGTAASPAPKSRRVINAEGGSARTFFVCTGLNSERVTDYSSLSNINRGVCLQYWDFSHDAWRSKLCDFSATTPGYQCDHCRVALSHISAARCPELFGGRATDQVVDSASNVSGLLVNQYRMANSDSEFLQKAEVKSLITIQ
jgi:hypothetical protein